MKWEWRTDARCRGETVSEHLAAFNEVQLFLNGTTELLPAEEAEEAEKIGGLPNTGKNQRDVGQVFTKQRELPQQSSILDIDAFQNLKYLLKNDIYLVKLTWAISD